MLELAVVYGIVVWLACWTIDIVAALSRGPVMFEVVLKLVVILVSLTIILYRLSHHGWLLGA